MIEMNSKSPFSKEKPKNNIYYSGRVWNANDDGRCNGLGDHQIFVGPEYVWFSDGFSIPLNWIKQVNSIGPGFKISWYNELNKKTEVIFLCVRVLFGHNESERDEIIRSIQKAKEEFNSEYSQKKDNSEIVCYECGDTGARLYDFVAVSSFGFSFSRKVERLLLCKFHARAIFKYYFIRNFVLGFFGFLPFAARGNMENAKMLFNKDVITKRELKKYKWYSRLRFILFILIFCLFAIYVALFGDTI